MFIHTLARHRPTSTPVPALLLRYIAALRGFGVVVFCKAVGTSCGIFQHPVQHRSNGRVGVGL